MQTRGPRPDALSRYAADGEHNEDSTDDRAETVVLEQRDGKELSVTVSGQLVTAMVAGATIVCAPPSVWRPVCDFQNALQ